MDKIDKKKIRIILFLLLIPLINAVTLDDTLITSIGLNSTINVSNFSITFDKLEVSNNAITFTNLYYLNPLSCNLATSTSAIYNYTEVNKTIELPPENCSNTGNTGSGQPPKINATSEEEEKGEAKLKGLIESNKKLIIILVIILLVVCLILLAIIIDISRRKKNLSKTAEFFIILFVLILFSVIGYILTKIIDGKRIIPW